MASNKSDILLKRLGFLTVLLTHFALVGCCNDKEVPNYIKQLRSPDPKIRNNAALELGSCGSPKADRAVPDLIRLLYDPNVGVQSSAAYALRRIATPEAEKALERATNKK